MSGVGLHAGVHSKRRAPRVKPHVSHSGVIGKMHDLAGGAERRDLVPLKDLVNELGDLCGELHRVSCGNKTMLGGDRREDA